MLKELKSSLANPGPVLPFLALVAATGFWGSSFLTVAEALSDTDPFTLVFLRFALGTLVLAVILRKTLRSSPCPSRATAPSSTAPTSSIAPGS